MCLNCQQKSTFQGDLIIYNEYLFRQKSRIDRFYKCSVATCNAYIYMNDNGEGIVASEGEVGHSCAEDHLVELSEMFKENLFILCVGDDDHENLYKRLLEKILQGIINEKERKEFEDIVESCFSYESIRLSLSKHREIIFKYKNEINLFETEIEMIQFSENKSGFLFDEKLKHFLNNIDSLNEREALKGLIMSKYPSLFSENDGMDSGDEFISDLSIDPNLVELSKLENADLIPEMYFTEEKGVKPSLKEEPIIIEENEEVKVLRKNFKDKVMDKFTSVIGKIMFDNSIQISDYEDKNKRVNNLCIFLENILLKDGKEIIDNITQQCLGEIAFLEGLEIATHLEEAVIDDSYHKSCQDDILELVQFGLSDVEIGNRVIDFEDLVVQNCKSEQDLDKLEQIYREVMEDIKEYLGYDEKLKFTFIVQIFCPCESLKPRIMHNFKMEGYKKEFVEQLYEKAASVDDHLMLYQKLLTEFINSLQIEDRLVFSNDISQTHGYDRIKSKMANIREINRQKLTKSEDFKNKNKNFMVELFRMALLEDDHKNLYKNLVEQTVESLSDQHLKDVFISKNKFEDVESDLIFIRKRHVKKQREEKFQNKLKEFSSEIYSRATQENDHESLFKITLEKFSNSIYDDQHRKMFLLSNKYEDFKVKMETALYTSINDRNSSFLDELLKRSTVEIDHKKVHKIVMEEFLESISDECLREMFISQNKYEQVKTQMFERFKKGIDTLQKNVIKFTDDIISKCLEGSEKFSKEVYSESLNNIIEEIKLSKIDMADILFERQISDLYLFEIINNAVRVKVTQKQKVVTNNVLTKARLFIGEVRQWYSCHEFVDTIPVDIISKFLDNLDVDEKVELERHFQMRTSKMVDNCIFGSFSFLKFKDKIDRMTFIRSLENKLEKIPEEAFISSLETKLEKVQEKPPIRSLENKLEKVSEKEPISSLEKAPKEVKTVPSINHPVSLMPLELYQQKIAQRNSGNNLKKIPVNIPAQAQKPSEYPKKSKSSSPLKSERKDLNPKSKAESIPIQKSTKVPPRIDGPDSKTQNEYLTRYMSIFDDKSKSDQFSRFLKAQRIFSQLDKVLEGESETERNRIAVELLESLFIHSETVVKIFSR